MPSCGKVLFVTPNRSLTKSTQDRVGSLPSQAGENGWIGFIVSVPGFTPTLKSPRFAKGPNPPPRSAFGIRIGWLKMLSKSAPKAICTRSPNANSLCTPKLTPQPPGPRRMFRLATCALSKTSAPTVGGANALGSNIWSPTPWLKLPVTSGLYAPLKSPVASIELVAMLPGPTNRALLKQLSQYQNGVKLVPVF